MHPTAKPVCHYSTPREAGLLPLSRTTTNLFLLETLGAFVRSMIVGRMHITSSHAGLHVPTAARTTSSSSPRTARTTSGGSTSWSWCTTPIAGSTARITTFRSRRGLNGTASFWTPMRSSRIPSAEGRMMSTVWAGRQRGLLRREEDRRGPRRGVVTAVTSAAEVRRRRGRIWMASGANNLQLGVQTATGNNNQVAASNGLFSCATVALRS